jgi:hypothetical protein
MSHPAFSKYLKLIAGSCFLGLIGVATINYTVDPANIYPSPLTFSSRNKPSVSEVTKQLIQSDFGIFLPEGTWNLRDIKRELALHPTSVQCAVIGSSHIMKISSFRKDSSLTHNCSSLINIGVPGGSLEDYLALSESILQNKKPPQTIVFGIDPWSLKFNKDQRWRRYELDTNNMKARLANADETFHASFDRPLESGNSLAMLLHLINHEYFLRSMGYILQKKRNWMIQFAPEFDQKIKPDTKVLLPDGTIIDPAKNTQKESPRKISGIHDYKMIDKGQWFNSNAIKTFILLVRHLQKHNFKIIFALTPYHPAVWSLSKQPIVTGMKIIEAKIHEIAKTTGVLVIGSYQPENIGCTADEFVDAMHVDTSCFKKLEGLSFPYHLQKTAEQ